MSALQFLSRRPLLAGFASFSSAAVFGAAPPVGSTTVPPSTSVVELDAYIVHASPFARTADELNQTISVLAGPQLDARRTSSLGETLAGTPGVASTYFGPGASRPIIRGLGGERIRVLTNGLGTIDVSPNSPDHAVSLDPALIERIEIVRGPSTLLYGSSAVGGVVNVVDHQVPAEKPATETTGFLEAHHGTNADEKSGVAHLTGAAGDFAWQVSFRRRESDDLDIPGFAGREHEHGGADEAEGHARGVLPNSAIDITSGSAGLSWFWNGGFAGAAITTFDTRYGVPGHEHEETASAEPDDDHGAVQIDLEQRRLDLRSEITEPFGPFRSGRLRFGYADYEHLELEGDEIGTRFANEGYEARLDLVHQPIGVFDGAIGAQIQHNRLAAEGEEAFLPPTRTLNRALFAVEEILQGALRWQFGARLETQDVDVRNGSGVSRVKDALSLSGGGLWTISDAWTLAFSLARTERTPTAQEMFANGPHIATRAFELGNPDLGKEKSTGLDLSLRRRAGAVTGSVSVFVNDFDHFIFEESTGEAQDGLPVYRFVAHDARFHGAEAEATWHLHETRAHTLDLTFSADLVRAENRTAHAPLPRIPPWRAGATLSYTSERWSAGLAVQHTAKPTRLAPFETPTDGYVLVSAYAHYTLPLGGPHALALFVRGSNLTDEEARPHTSFLKDVAPLPGRNVILGARWIF